MSSELNPHGETQRDQGIQIKFVCVRHLNQDYRGVVILIENG